MRSRRSSRPSWSSSAFTLAAAASLRLTLVASGACVSCTVLLCPPRSEVPQRSFSESGQHRRGGASSHGTARARIRRGPGRSARRLVGREAPLAGPPVDRRDDARPLGRPDRPAGQELRQGTADAQAKRGPGPPPGSAPAAADHPQGGLPADAGVAGGQPGHLPRGRRPRRRELPARPRPRPGPPADPPDRRQPAQHRQPVPDHRGARRGELLRPQRLRADLHQPAADGVLAVLHRRLRLPLPQDQEGDRRAVAEGEPEGRRLVRREPLDDDPPLALPQARGHGVLSPGIPSDHVEYRRLGRSGLTISEIAYGNWLTHGSQVEEDAAHACVSAALDAGITTFDTADVYAQTKAESVLGRALAGQRREGLEIFTKVYWPTGPGPNDRGLSRKHIIESCNASLKRLQTDYVDLYQAHRYDETVPLEETMTAFADLVRQGKALYIGVSEWRADEIAAAAELARELKVQLISNQPQYSMLWRVIESEVVPTSEKEGISQIVWSPLAQGVLTGKYLPGQQPPADSRGGHASVGGSMQGYLTDDVLTRVQQLRPIADELGLSMAQLAVAWVLQNQNVAAAIIGASRPEQVRDNVKAAGVQLPAEVMTRIDEALGEVVERDPAKTSRG